MSSGEPCETVYKKYELILAMIKLKGPLTHRYIEAQINNSKVPIPHTPQAIASLNMCGYVANVDGWVRLTDDWISESRSRELLKQYNIDPRHIDQDS